MANLAFKLLSHERTFIAPLLSKGGEVPLKAGRGGINKSLLPPCTVTQNNDFNLAVRPPLANRTGGAIDFLPLSGGDVLKHRSSPKFSR